MVAVPELVTDAAHGLDGALGARGRGGELLAQRAHVNVHRAGAAGEGDVPHVGEQAVAREHAAWRGHEGLEQVELLGGERHGHAVGGHGVAPLVEHDAPEREAVRLGRLPACGRLGAAEQRPHAGQQLHHAERLGQVVVGAQVEPVGLVELVALGREHHDGDVPCGRLAPQAAQHREAVHIGQHDVEEHEVGNGLGAGVEELSRRREALRADARLGEGVERELEDARVILEIVDRGFRHGFLLGLCAGSTHPSPEARQPNRPAT